MPLRVGRDAPPRGRQYVAAGPVNSMDAIPLHLRMRLIAVDTERHMPYSGYCNDLQEFAMSCEEATMQALKGSGHRLTPQRLMVLSALRHVKGHMTAGQILHQVKETYPYIDASTVYRNLGVLKNMRLISETDVGGGEYLYEWLEPTRHHHLVCRECDSLTLLDHRFVESLGADVLKDYGFHADLDHLAIFGTCLGCREKA